MTKFHANNFACGTEGFFGPDRVFSFKIQSPQIVQIVGEADFDADWAFSSDCASGSADIFCVDRFGPYQPPECSTILAENVDMFSVLNKTLHLEPGKYYLWVDGYSEFCNGNFSFEIVSTDPEPLPGCSAESIFTQLPHLEFEQNHVSPSDDGIPRALVEKINGTSIEVCSMKWWGIEMTELYDSCSHLQVFDIIVYSDAEGRPGDIISTIEGRPDVSETGIQYYTHNLLEYSVEFTEPITSGNVWISIIARNDITGCRFWWAHSPDGDGEFQWWNSVTSQWTIEHGDLAICLL